MPDININPNDVYIYTNGAVEDNSSTAVTQENTAVSNMLSGVQSEDELVALDLEEEKTYPEEISKLMDTKNGVITGTKQHSIGDCFLLSAVNALSYTEQGQEILANILEYDENEGAATVHLVTGDYTVTDDEWIDAYYNKYSSGDADMLILELAIQKAMKDTAAIQVTNKKGSTVDFDLKTDIDNGGSPQAVLCMLTGKYTNFAFTSEPDEINAALDSVQEGSRAATAGTDIPKDETRYITNLTTGEQVKLSNNHVYAIKSVNGNEVTITNPWNSDEEIVISREELLSNFDNIASVDLNQKDENKVVVVRREETEEYLDIVKYMGASKLDNIKNIEKNEEFDENGSLKNTTYILEYEGSSKKEIICVTKTQNGQTEVLNYEQGESCKAVYIFEDQEDGSAIEIDSRMEISF